MGCSECGFGYAMHGYLPDDAVISPQQCRRMEYLTNLPHRVGPAVLLPDVAFKPENHFATGLAVCFEGCYVPTAISCDINCAMAMVKTGINASDMDSGKWLGLLNAIDQRVRWYYKRTEPVVTPEELMEAIIAPEQACAKLGYSDVELQRVLQPGATLSTPLSPERVLRIMPEFALRGTRLSIGQLGGGNHFVEFHRVGEIFAPEAAAALGLWEDMVTFALHCGSPLSGLASIMYARRPWELVGIPRLKMLIRKALFHGTLPAGLSGLWKTILGSRIYRDDELIGRAFASAYDIAARATLVHHAMLIADIRNILADELGATSELLIDVSHNGIWREEIDGREVYVHRHGATSFWPGGRFPEGHPYAATGQPAFVGSTTYLPSGVFVPGPNVNKTHYSISHGTGRSFPESKMDAAEAEQRLAQAGVEYLWVGPEGSEKPSRMPVYRSIDTVRRLMEEAGMARMVAYMEPVASYHTR